jgi:hypothetical protein
MRNLTLYKLLIITQLVERPQRPKEGYRTGTISEMWKYFGCEENHTIKTSVNQLALQGDQSL